jgi:transcriptional regulator GlxA family with amidase domain
MHKVAILALDEMVLLDLTIPFEAFLNATDLKGKRCYDVMFCGPEKQIHASGIKLEVAKTLSWLKRAETIVIPGLRDPETRLPKEIISSLKSAHARGARLVSICSGALLLAQTGLLNGKRATTHWMAADALRSRHPEIEVDPNVLYVEHPRLYTSAGGFAGMDLCLHLVRKDFGAAVAMKSARFAVTPLERAGVHAQFIQHVEPQAEDSIQKTTEWIRSNIQKDLDVERIAQHARVSIRTLSRQFKKQLGLSPQRYVINARVARARELLETTDRSIDQIAELSGFPSSLSLRDHFRRAVQVSPSMYRKSYR